MFKINALGKACPLPVIEAHKALKDHDAVEITVDNEIATENLKNLSQEMNCSYTSAWSRKELTPAKTKRRSRRVPTIPSSSMRPSWVSAMTSWARTCSRLSSIP